MKKLLLFSLMLWGFFANQNLYAQKPGMTCDNPIVISSLPYQTTDNTANYGDLYDTSQSATAACDATPTTTNYMAGNDVFYSFTAAKTGNVSFKMTPTSTYSSIFIYGTCPIDGNCLAGSANTGSSTRIINNFPVTAGSTYIIAISSSSGSQTVGYTLLMQEENCVPPVGNTPSTASVTTTEATLSWSNPSNATEWRVAVQPTGSPLPTAVDQIDIVTSNTWTKTGLTPGTPYQYWVSSKCDDGTYTSWAGPYVFNTQICEESNKCNYTFRMTDAAANGWNGATIQVRQNGIVLATIGSTFVSGAGPVSISVPLCKDVPFDLYWNAAGSKPNECVVAVINSFGQTIYTKAAGVGSAGTFIYDNLVNCDKPQCDIAPTILTSTNLTTSGATLQWNAPATTAWEIYVVESGSPAPTAATPPTYTNVGTNPFDVTGYLADTCYDFYVRVKCSPAPSAWSAAGKFCTAPTCPRPKGMAVPTAEITATTANLYWTNGTSTDTSWEILLIKAVGPDYGTPATPTAGYVTKPGDFKFQINSPAASPYTMTGLEQSTIYYYYVRTLCLGNDKSVWAGPVKFNTTTCAVADKCDYTFRLTDSGKDGWNNARMEVRQNGIVVATIGAAITDAGPYNYAVKICNGIPFDVNWSLAGTKPQEVGLQIINPFGDPIFTKLPGKDDSLKVITPADLAGNCTLPSCPKPSVPKILTVTQNTVTLGWTAPAAPGATQWEVFVVPTGTAQPINTSAVVPTNVFNTNPFTVTGLDPSVRYDFYMRSVCSDGVSTWTILNPVTFTTTPPNDEYSGAIAVPVNATSTIETTTKGNTLGATKSSPDIPCQGFADDDVWFSFIATSDNHIINIQNIQGTTTDINHTLYSIDSGNLTQLYCSNPNVSLATGLIPGNTYIVRVYTNDNGISRYASFEIGITTPPTIPNDECSTAILVPVNDKIISGQSVKGSVTGATGSTVNGTCIGTADDDVWYSFVAKGSVQKITLSSISGTSTNLNHAVYSGDCSNLTNLYCSADNSLTSTYSNYTLGQTYYIRIWSNEAVKQIADFTLSVEKMVAPIQSTTTQYSTEELVTKVLMNNPCVSVSNITASTGTNFNSVNGIGSFSIPTGSDFPISKGLIISTGNAGSVPGPNTKDPLSEGSLSWPGDTQLEAIVLKGTGVNMVSHNASKLEFDFVSQNDFMSFNFLLASEEYGTYQCNYSDSFAFLLTDKATYTTTNLAVVPGTSTPVSVVTIRDEKYNTGCSSEHSAYFDHYYGSNNGNVTSADKNPEEAPINFNGMTNLMTASSAIIPGHEYHIKLVIADRGDTAMDSAVFIQGGSFNSGEPECMEHFKLVAFNDANANGVKDSGESDFSYGSFVIQKNNEEKTTVSSAKEGYNLYDSNPDNKYSFSYQINQEYAAYYNVSASFNNLNLPAGSGTKTLYFPVTLTQTYKDVSVTVIPVSDPVPGSTYVNKVVYKNNGTIAVSGTVTFNKPEITTIASISESSAVMNDGGFTYDFANLLPNETRTLDVTLNLPASASVGDILNSTSTVTAAPQVQGGGKTVAQSIIQTYAFKQQVASSKASTSITEAHSPVIQMENFKADEYLTYTINFQNMGTANAISAKLEQVLDEKLDINSLRMVSTSHNTAMEIVGNKVIWKLDYINLVGAPQSDALSRGYVTFKIKMLPGITGGTIVPSQATVYFDNSPAVTTNTYNTEFVGETLSTPTFESQNIAMFPNPASAKVQIRLQNSAETLESIAIYDLLGHLVQKVSAMANDHSEISVGDLAKGVYLVEITTQNQFKSTQKLIIQ